MINNKTKLYISASYAPGNFGASIYNKLFEKYNINAVYMPRKALDAKTLIAAVKVLDICGCSVSMPLKSEVIEYLDEVDEVAKQTLSVNTIINKNEKLIGYNTDFYGVRQVLADFNYERVLIYGAGSVTNSIILALKNLDCKQIYIMARRPEQAMAIAQRHDIQFIKHADIMNISWELLINATPAGNQNYSEELFSLVPHSAAVFDLSVSSEDTQLIKLAKTNNLPRRQGIDMAKYQLQKQFEYYTGIFPEITVIDEIISKYY